MATYFFASSRPWHRLSFSELIKASDDDWIYISSINQLDRALSKKSPRYIFFVHWNWVVPESILDAHECVCFHMTDVPYGRGGSPLQNLILAGHTQTMLTALKMDKDLDTGPVYTKRPMYLDGSAAEIYNRAGILSIEIIQWMIQHYPQPTPQEGEVVTFKRRKPEQSSLPNSGTLKQAYDFIRMLDAEGYPHAFIEHGNYLINFRNARLDGERVVAEVEIKLQSKT